MVFLGANCVSAATATRQERLYLSSTQEAMRVEGFGEAETLLGDGSWALREGVRPRLLVYASVHGPLCLRPWPCSSQVQVLPLLPSPTKPRPSYGASLDHFHLLLVSVLFPPFLYLGPVVLSLRAGSWPMSPSVLSIVLPSPHTQPEDGRCCLAS